jgi:hypothetical protein
MSWEQYGLIAQEAALDAEAEAAAPPLACPRCGEPFRPGPDGQLYCLFDGYQPDC